MVRLSDRFDGQLLSGVYRLSHSIGAGAMGVVYAAQHIHTQADVAVKVIHPHIEQADLNLARFEREVSISARVHHQGIVQVYDAGRDPDTGSLFVAMERLRGHSLENRLRLQEDATLADALRFLQSVCAPLAAAHEAGIIHRDLKPDNVFVHRMDAHNDFVGYPRSVHEQIKLLDFGIARDLVHGSLTATNSGLGTPNYMAPEQATDARRVTPAADLWSLGVMLYWYIRGKLPFPGDGPFDTVLRAISEPHEPIPADEAPKALAELVDACLEKDPGFRPKGALEVERTLSYILSSFNLEGALAQPKLNLEPRHAALSHPANLAIGDAARDLLSRAKAAAKQSSIPEDTSIVFGTYEDGTSGSGPRALNKKANAGFGLFGTALLIVSSFFAFVGPPTRPTTEDAYQSKPLSQPLFFKAPIPLPPRSKIPPSPQKPRRKKTVKKEKHPVVRQRHWSPRLNIDKANNGANCSEPKRRTSGLPVKEHSRAPTVKVTQENKKSLGEKRAFQEKHTQKVPPAPQDSPLQPQLPEKEKVWVAPASQASRSLNIAEAQGLQKNNDQREEEPKALKKPSRAKVEPSASDFLTF